MMEELWRRTGLGDIEWIKVKLEKAGQERKDSKNLLWETVPEQILLQKITLQEMVLQKIAMRETV